MLKDLLERARRIAEEHLPEDVLDAGRKLGRTVAAYAPAPLAEVIHQVTGDAPEADAPAGADPSEAKTKPEPRVDAAPAPTPAAEPPAAAPVVTMPAGREDPAAVLERVKAKAERGLKPEDRLVVVYSTPEQDDEVAEIMKLLDGVEAEIRPNDLRREPQTAKQLAVLTGVMVPPYVFINGKYWGARYELEALVASGDLELVLANRLDEVGDETRRMGRLHDSYSDELSVDNILARWKLGHILCVDDLDSWYEVERDGTERFFYQGGPRPIEDMPAVAEEIVRGVEAEQYEATWMLEPSVHLA